MERSGSSTSSAGDFIRYKVWDASRETERLIKASSRVDLIAKGCSVLGIEKDDFEKLVCEDDGTEVNDEGYFECLESDTKIMFLKKGEKWQASNDQKPLSTLEERDLRMATKKEAIQRFLNQCSTAFKMIILPQVKGSSLLKGSRSFDVLVKMLKKEPLDVYEFTVPELEEILDRSSDFLADCLGKSKDHAIGIQSLCQDILDKIDDEVETVWSKPSALSAMMDNEKPRQASNVEDSRKIEEKRKSVVKMMIPNAHAGNKCLQQKAKRKCGQKSDGKAKKSKKMNYSQTQTSTQERKTEATQTRAHTKKYINRHDRKDGGRLLFTSESVGEGHPDKVCDQISDAILDAHLSQDPHAKVACETVIKAGIVVLAGEISSKAQVDYQKIVRKVIKDIGYDEPSKGFDVETCSVLEILEEQSPEMAPILKESEGEENISAGNQCFVFGYATDETDECMPLTALLSHRLNQKIAELRRNGDLPWARPDTKSLVTVEYEEVNGAIRPRRVHTVVISVQHDENITLRQLQGDLKKKVIDDVIPADLMDRDTKLELQPSGKFIIGGPQGDAGVTGRKIIVDTYGGWGAHGGGAFSGKDFTKVDRSASYAARWVAKSLVKAGLCKRVLLQVSYAIAISEPLSISVFTYGTSEKSESELLEIVNKNFDLRLGAIVNELKLRDPIYQRTACYGHFGRSNFPWEIPKVLEL